MKKKKVVLYIYIINDHNCMLYKSFKGGLAIPYDKKYAKCLCISKFTNHSKYLKIYGFMCFDLRKYLKSVPQLWPRITHLDRKR